MHEGNFTNQIVENILRELEKYPDHRPTSAKVLVGEMLHLVPDSVQMHFELTAKGTRLEGMKLELVEVPVQVKCRDCMKEGVISDHHLLICSFCASRAVDLTGGDQVVIESVELET